MAAFNVINEFLNKLDKNSIYYKMNKIRPESIMVEVAVPIPGQRWEIVFMNDGTVEIEKFISDSSFYGEEELKIFLDEFSD